MYVTNITLGVTDSTGIEFSTTFIAYPGPWYELEYENGTKNTKIKSRITNKAVNIFTINFNEAGVTQEDYGTYYLRVGNIFGNGTIIVNVLPQRKLSTTNYMYFFFNLKRVNLVLLRKNYMSKSLLFCNHM